MELYFRIRTFFEYYLPLVILIACVLLIGGVILKIKFDEWKGKTK